MRQYWQFDYLGEYGWKTRYFYGTEAAVQSRIKRYKAISEDLRNISRSRVQFLKTAKQANFISL